jgi:hypothetical protein
MDEPAKTAAETLAGDGIQAKIISAEEARREWRSIVDHVLAGEDFVVERYSRPSVAIIAYDDYAAIHPQLEEMRIARLTDQVRVAWQQGKIKVLPWDERAPDTGPERTQGSAQPEEKTKNKRRVSAKRNNS